MHEHLATDVVSIGRYVLSGGELAAMVICDAVIRKLPARFGHVESAVEESFSEALEGAPEYPHTEAVRLARPHRAGHPAVWRSRSRPGLAARKEQGTGWPGGIRRGAEPV